MFRYGEKKVPALDCKYRNNPMYSDGQVSANSVDPIQTPQNLASDKGLHCLSSIKHL